MGRAATKHDPETYVIFVLSVQYICGLHTPRTNDHHKFGDCCYRAFANNETAICANESFSASFIHLHGRIKMHVVHRNFSTPIFLSLQFTVSELFQ